jgi:hypothetical protein
VSCQLFNVALAKVCLGAFFAVYFNQRFYRWQRELLTCSSNATSSLSRGGKTSLAD